jgi:hypothetical protein
MLIDVDDSSFLEIEHVEHSVCPSRCAIIHRQHHVLLVSNNLTKMRVEEAIVAMTTMTVRLFEVAENVDLLGYFEHNRTYNKQPN